MIKIKKKKKEKRNEFIRDGRIIEISESRHSTVELHSSPDSCPRKQEDKEVQGEYILLYRILDYLSRSAYTRGRLYRNVKELHCSLGKYINLSTTSFDPIHTHIYLYIYIYIDPV